MDMQCKVCKEYEPNMAKLLSVTMSAWAHGVTLGEGYIRFRYCPWCGSPLIDEEPEEAPSEKESM